MARSTQPGLLARSRPQLISQPLQSALHFTPYQGVLDQPGTLARRTDHPQAHRNVTELEGDIRKWIWAKTADEILDNLASYCA